MSKSASVGKRGFVALFARPKTKLSAAIGRQHSGFLLPLTIFLCVFLIPPFAFVFLESVRGDHWTLIAYQRFFSGRLYLQAFANTVSIGGMTAIVAVFLGYVVAYHLSRLPPRRRAVYLMLVMLPFWTSILVKSFAFTVILGNSGIVNTLLKAVLGPNGGLSMIFNRTGVIIGLTHWLLPFAVFPILSSLLAQDRSLRLAAEVMGAGSTRIFWTIVFPQTIPSVLASVIIVAVIAMGSFVTPALLGGRGDLMMANLVDFYIREALDWQMASAIAIILISIAALALLLLTCVRSAKSLQRAH